jgi:hypothetical protein
LESRTTLSPHRILDKNSSVFQLPRLIMKLNNSGTCVRNPKVTSFSFSLVWICLKLLPHNNKAKRLRYVSNDGLKEISAFIL